MREAQITVATDRLRIVKRKLEEINGRQFPEIII